MYSGEWPVNDKFGDGPLKNLDIAVNSKFIKRIGHGIQLYRRNDLMEKVIEDGIFVECCLTSNVGWKVPSYEEHPIKVMYEHGIKCSLNSDNLLLSGDKDRQPSPVAEVLHLVEDVGLPIEALSNILGYGAESCLPFTFHSRQKEGLLWLEKFKNEVNDTLRRYIEQRDLSA